MPLFEWIEMQTWRHQWRNWCHRFSKTLLSARNDEQPPESSRPNCNHLSSVPQNRVGEVPRFGRNVFPLSDKLSPKMTTCRNRSRLCGWPREIFGQSREIITKPTNGMSVFIGLFCMVMLKKV